MPLPSITYSTIQQLINDINTRFIPNGMELITGDIGNSQLNGLANFIVKYTLNSGLAGISSSNGIVPLSKPVTVFTVAPTSISWPDNIQNEYYIVNATGDNIPLSSGFSYIDQYAISQTFIPARASIHIAKATNGSWIQINNLPGVGVLPTQITHEGEFLTTNGISASWFSPCLFITSNDFESDGVTYLNVSLVRNKYLLFWNDLPRFIYSEDQNPSQIEWEYETSGGFKILMPGFDANSNNYYLCLFLKGLNS
jgi:hypothetical protein